MCSRAEGTASTGSGSATIAVRDEAAVAAVPMRPATSRPTAMVEADRPRAVPDGQAPRRATLDAAGQRRTVPTDTR